LAEIERGSAVEETASGTERYRLNGKMRKTSPVLGRESSKSHVKSEKEIRASILPDGDSRVKKKKKKPDKSSRSFYNQEHPL